MTSPRNERKRTSSAARRSGRAACARRATAREGGPQRIAKLLARAGVASRREIERMIAEGRIALNGEKLTTPATLLDRPRPA
jgi:23S rRNA pseudouridine2605 synthase